MSYPVNLVLDGRPCLVVGGGTVALAKVTGLLDAGAAVTVVAPEVIPAIDALGVTIERRPYQRGEVAAYRFVVTATNDPDVNQAVFDDGEEVGVFVNAADDPERCSATLPARVRRGDLLVAVSTNGRSPAFSAWMRRRLDEEIGPEFGIMLDVVAEARAARPGIDAGTWQRALDSGMLELIRSDSVEEARDLLRRCLSSSSD